MNKRIELHEKLVAILGSSHVYFQPPSSIRLSYPCIVYSRNSVYDIYANDQRYIGKKSYTVTVITKDPDSMIPDKLYSLPLVSFNRQFVTDNLYHDVYNVYY